MITTEKSAIGSEKNGSSSEKTTVITTKKTTEKIVRLMKSNPYITIWGVGMTGGSAICFKNAKNACN